MISIFSPQMWFLNDKYCKDWDSFVLDNLDSLKLIDLWTSEVGGVEMWTANFPYAYGTARHITTNPTGVVIGTETVRPSRRTTLKLRKKHLDLLSSIDPTNFKEPDINYYAICDNLKRKLNNELAKEAIER